MKPSPKNSHDTIVINRPNPKIQNPLLKYFMRSCFSVNSFSAFEKLSYREIPTTIKNKEAPKYM